MKNIEFYTTPSGGVMINDCNGTRILKETDRHFISLMIEKVGEFYPEALSSLSITYQKCRYNIAHFEFCIVSRFIRCNFGKFDSTMDIDQFGNLNFEEVDCPLRGECKLEGIVCKPKFNSNLSNREIEVMRCFYEGFSPEAIADKMCLSLSTVVTHKKNAMKRTNTHSLAEFIVFSKDKNLFKN